MQHSFKIASRNNETIKSAKPSEYKRLTIYTPMHTEKPLQSTKNM